MQIRLKHVLHISLCAETSTIEILLLSYSIFDYDIITNIAFFNIHIYLRYSMSLNWNQYINVTKYFLSL